MLEAERADAAGGGGRADGGDAAPRRPRTPATAELAWAAALPWALAGAAAIALLGPAVGHALFRPGTDALWPATWWEAQGAPEPAEHGRYLLALLIPLGLAATILASAGRAPALPHRAIRASVLAAQAGVLALVALAVLGQHEVLAPSRPLWHAFGAATLAIAAALLLLATCAMRAPRVRTALARIVRERRWSRVACAAAAVAVAAVWLLEALATNRAGEDVGRMNWTLNDAFAVLDGHDPLVDYHLIYAKLLPYPAALALKAFGTTPLVYALLMTTLSLLALVAVYAIFRRLVGSSLLALGLFVPFVAVSDMLRTMPITAMWPMRYGGAYLVAWLTARHVAGERPRRSWPLFAVAGLAAVNELNFGMAALLASVAALLCARPPRSPREAARLAGAVASGALIAIAAVSLLTLARAGSLPRPALLLEWPRIFTALGWFSLPIPTLGLHLAIYATFCGAVAAAAVRLARRDEDALLTAMLAWSGVFGLLAGAYYVGRSDDLKLASMLSAWAFALSLLTILCVRALGARGWRAPTIAELLVLLGFAASVCTVGQLVSPTAMLQRLTAATPAPRFRPFAERLIGRYVSRGQKVVILVPEGFRIAYELGVDNVAPYQMQNAIVTRHQMRTLIDAIERDHVDEVFMPTPGARLLGEGEASPEQVRRIVQAGFAIGASEGGILRLHRAAD